MRASFSAVVTALAITLASSAFVTPSHAEPSDAELAAARELFEQVRKLEEQDKWSEALAHLRTIAKIKMTAQVRFHIALCEEHLGKLVSALNDFQQTRIEADAQGVPQVASEAAEHVAALKPRIGSLKLNVPPDVEDLSVTIDDQPLSSALLSVPVPIDPGRRMVVVSASSRETFTRELEVGEGQSLTIDVELVPLPQAAPTPPPPPKKAPASAPPVGFSAPAHDATAESSGVSTTTIGWVLLGTGGVSLVGAGVAALVRSSAISEIDDSCPTHIDCDPSLQSAHDRAQTSGTVAAILGVVGVAASATGAVVVYMSSKGDSPPTTATISPAIQRDRAILTGAVRW